MRTLIIVLVAIVGGAELWKRYGDTVSPSSFSPFSATTTADVAAQDHSRPNLIVYGRNSCGFTTTMRQTLSQHGIEFEYRIVDNAAVADELHARMTAQGISTRRYDLPVVEIDGNIRVRPTPGGVIHDYTQ
jgi:glutaredoxin